ncbi:hypothetical protein D3C81_2063790 [compost metagenome]
MSYKILKNAGVLPEEVTLRAELTTLEGLLEACRNSGEDTSSERKAIQTELSVKRMRLQELLRERGLDGGMFSEYGERIRQRLLGEDR